MPCRGTFAGVLVLLVGFSSCDGGDLRFFEVLLLDAGDDGVVGSSLDAVAGGLSTGFAASSTFVSRCGGGDSCFFLLDDGACARVALDFAVVFLGGMALLLKVYFGKLL